MSRSGYTDEDENNTAGLWFGAVRRAISGKRGQALLRDILAALDAMPDKSLAAESLVNDAGEFCTLGVLGSMRGMDLKSIDPEDPEQVAEAFRVSPSLVREIVYQNDEWIDDYKWVEVEICGPIRPAERRIRSVRRAIPEHEVAAQRWLHMRKWVEDQIIITDAAQGGAA